MTKINCLAELFSRTKLRIYKFRRVFLLLINLIGGDRWRSLTSMCVNKQRSKGRGGGKIRLVFYGEIVNAVLVCILYLYL